MIYSEETTIFAEIKVRNEAHGGLVWPETVDLNLESITNISYSNDFFGERGFVRILFPFFQNTKISPCALIGANAIRTSTTLLTF